MQIACPKCATRYTVSDTLRGKHATCKKCGDKFTISEPAEVEPELSLEAAAPTVVVENPMSLYLQEAQKEVRASASGLTRTDTKSSRKSETREIIIRFVALLLIPGVAMFLAAALGVLCARFLLVDMLRHPQMASVVGGFRLTVTIMALITSTGAVLAIAWRAFYEDVTQGLLVFFVPFYSCYYVASRWDDSARFYYIYVIAICAFTFVRGIAQVG